VAQPVMARLSAISVSIFTILSVNLYCGLNMEFEILFIRQNTPWLCRGDEWRGIKLFRSRSEAERRNASGLCPEVVYLYLIISISNNRARIAQESRKK
jgi:hypothetical protein